MANWTVFVLVFLVQSTLIGGSLIAEKYSKAKEPERITRSQYCRACKVYVEEYAYAVREHMDELAAEAQKVCFLLVTLLCVSSQ